MGPLQSKTVPFGRLVHRDHSNAKGASGGIAALRAYNCRLINNLSGPRMGLIIRTTAHAPVAARMEAAVLRDVSGPRLPCGLGNRQWSSDFSGVDGGRPAAAVSLRRGKEFRFGLRFASRGLEGPDNTHPRLASCFERLWRDMICDPEDICPWGSSQLLLLGGETPILPSIMNGGGSLAR